MTVPRPKVRLKYGRWLIYLFLILWGLGALLPLFWMFASSMRSNAEIDRNSWALPSSINFSNYFSLLVPKTSTVTSIVYVTNPPVGQFLLNSSIISFSAVAGILLVSIPAGYALAKRSRVTDTLFYFFIAMIAVPAPAVLLPVFYLDKALGIFDTYEGLIFPYIAFNLPFSIALARAFFKSFPAELEEAARIDGLGDLSIFTRIVLPLSTVILVTVAIVNFPNVWNELLFALVLVPSNSVRTIQPGLLIFTSTMGTNWGFVFAGLVLSSLPMIVFYIIFQRYIIKGLNIGAIKG